MQRAERRRRLRVLDSTAGSAAAPPGGGADEERDRAAMPPPPPAKAPRPAAETDEGAYYQKLVDDVIMTRRERRAEELVRYLVDGLSPDPRLSAVEQEKEWRAQVRERLTRMSVTLYLKLQPQANSLIEARVSRLVEASFTTISRRHDRFRDMVEMYRRCFAAFVDARDHVSFALTNALMAGRVSARDHWQLGYFAMLTNRRVKKDEMLQLTLVGRTTCGKSTLFEAPLEEGAHVTCNQEKGVGRFQVSNKTILMFHDVHIWVLVEGADSDKIKTMARTETTVSKIFGSTVVLPEMFLFVTSNERLFEHSFRALQSSVDSFVTGGGRSPAPATPLRGQQLSAPVGIRRIYSSEVRDGSGRRRASEESVDAVRNRFVEAFVREPPPLDPEDLPKNSKFQRMHAILGTFDRMLGVMRSYGPDDFYSTSVPLYVLQGLCNNLRAYVLTFGSEAGRRASDRLGIEVGRYLGDTGDDANVARLSGLISEAWETAGEVAATAGPSSARTPVRVSDSETVDVAYEPPEESEASPYADPFSAVLTPLAASTPLPGSPPEWPTRWGDDDEGARSASPQFSSASIAASPDTTTASRPCTQDLSRTEIYDPEAEEDGGEPWKIDPDEAALVYSELFGEGGE